MFAHLFLDRPILSAVISSLIVLRGGLDVRLPIEQYRTWHRHGSPSAQSPLPPVLITNNVAAPMRPS
jgi:hypothetical protein